MRDQRSEHRCAHGNKKFILNHGDGDHGNHVAILWNKKQMLQSSHKIQRNVTGWKSCTKAVFDFYGAPAVTSESAINFC